MVVVTLVEEYILLATLFEKEDEEEEFMMVVTLVEERMVLATLVEEEAEEEQEELMLLATPSEVQEEGMVEAEALGVGIAVHQAVAAALVGVASMAERRAPRPMPLGTMQAGRGTAEVDLE